VKGVVDLDLIITSGGSLAVLPTLLATLSAPESLLFLVPDRVSISIMDYINALSPQTLLSTSFYSSTGKGEEITSTKNQIC